MVSICDVYLLRADLTSIQFDSGVRFLLFFALLGLSPVNIVMLHGLFGSPENWRLVCERMVATATRMDLLHARTFFVPQLPINTQHIREDFSLDLLTDFLLNYFEQRDLDNVVLMGNSLGGQVAIDFCLKYPERVKNLVLTGSAGLHEGSLIASKYPRRSWEMIREKTEEVFYDRKHATDELICQTYDMINDRKYLRFLLKIAKATRNKNLKDDIKLLDLPTLIIWGENDLVTKPCVAEEFHKGIKGSKLFFIPECGHSPQIEKPEEFVEILEGFLQL